MITLDFDDIYKSTKNQFEAHLSDRAKNEELFNPIKKPRKILTSTHLKPLPLTTGSKPEAITSKFITTLLNAIGIEDEYIVPEVRLKSISFGGKAINKYPDFGIFNRGEGKSLLFEIETLNKPLDKSGDGEGIEQAQKWFHEFIGLERMYNAVITNFNEWIFLTHDEASHQMKPNKKSATEALEIIRDIALGKERSYLEEEKGDAITKDFYNEFRTMINKLLDQDDATFQVKNLVVLSGQNIGELQITYFRTIFFRMLFIKILLDWKLLPIDPIQEIFNEEKERNYFKSLKDLFFEVLNNEGDRRDVLDRFKELPYLNGGLFRLSDIESENPTISLNFEAIKKIWDLLKTYDFITSDENGESKKKNSKNAINPSILGYIFEKSIGDVRKQTGTYYTRSIITNYMSRNTIELFIVDKIKQKFKKILPWGLKTVREIRMYDIEIKAKIYDYIIPLLKNIKICDPAVGSGAFLVSSANLLLEFYTFFMKTLSFQDLKYLSVEEIEGDKRPSKDLVSLKTSIVQNNLYGVDINPSAIEICELRLWLWIVQPPSSLDTIDIKLSPLPNIEYNIREGNSLFGFTRGIKSIGRVDKVTKKQVKFAVISEWVGKEEESLSQMLLERNRKINAYYHENDETNRRLLRDELRKLTNEYNNNFNQILLEEYHEKEILGKKIRIKPEKFESIDLNNIFSVTIQFKTSIDLSDSVKNSLKVDNEDKKIKGITFRKNAVSLSYRVFRPKESDSFQQQDPKILCKKFIDAIGLEKIQWLDMQYLIDLSLIESLKPFHWSMEFSDFFLSRGFDIIIANPPYGNILSDIEKLILKGDITEDIYLNFLLKLTRNEIPFQYAGILTPKSYLLRQKYREVRNELLSKTGPYEITDIGSRQFPGATNEVQIIFFHHKHEYSNSLRIKDLFDNQLRIQYALNDNKTNVPLDTLNVCINNKCPFYDGTASFYNYTFSTRCPKCDKKADSLNRIRIKLDDIIHPIISNIEKKGNLNFLNSVEYPKMVRGEEDKGLKKVKEILQENDSQPCTFVYARDDFSYYYVDKNKSFDIDQIDPIHLKGDNYEYYKGPKLLIKHNSIVPETYYSEESICFTSSIYSLLNDETETLKYLSALYNSLLMQFYCIYGINNQKDTTINLNQYMIRHLPVLKSNKSVRNKITSKVDTLNALFSSSEGVINEEIRIIVKGIDDLIFEIYKITEIEKEHMINLVTDHVEFYNKVYEL